MQPYYPDAQPPAYGYSNQQLAAPQGWTQHGHGEPQVYEAAYNQGYPDNDPSPFHGRQAHQHHGYADSDMEFGDGGYYEDEEPRRGKRWLLIAAALIGAIGVGGALAYTYRSIVAPTSRVVASKSDTMKVKVGKDLGAERPPVKTEDPPSPPKAVDTTDDPASGDDQGPRKVKVIPIAPGSGQTASMTKPTPIPGITLYVPPESSAPPVAKETPPPVAKETPPPVKEKKEVVAPPGGRVTIGSPPGGKASSGAKEEEEEETPVAPPPPLKKPSQASVGAPKAPPPKVSTGSGMYVAVIKSEKTSMDAMKFYADLQQTYPEVLADKSFEVQEVDLSARKLGTMYRVVVGPPGSHNWATGVCAQLKAAGYVGCWVKEY